MFRFSGSATISGHWFWISGLPFGTFSRQTTQTRFPWNTAPNFVPISLQISSIINIIHLIIIRVLSMKFPRTTLKWRLSNIPFLAKPIPIVIDILELRPGHPTIPKPHLYWYISNWKTRFYVLTPVMWWLYNIDQYLFTLKSYWTMKINTSYIWMRQWKQNWSAVIGLLKIWRKHFFKFNWSTMKKTRAFKCVCIYSILQSTDTIFSQFQCLENPWVFSIKGYFKIKSSPNYFQNTPWA